MNKVVFLTNILIHVLLMSIFLTIFFFTVAKNVEKQIVEDQVKYILGDLIGNTFKGLDNNEKELIKKQVDKEFSSVSLKNEDIRVIQQNKKVFDKSLSFLAVLCSILIVIIVIMYIIYRFEFSYIKLLGISALFSLIMVAVTETSFLFLIAKNYLSADPNNIKLKIIEKLDK